MRVKTGAKGVSMATTLWGVFWFLLWYTFLVPSLKNTASVFYYFSCTPHDVIIFMPNTETSISLKRKKDIPKKKNVILLYFEKPFKYAAIVVHVIHAYKSKMRCLSRYRSVNTPKLQWDFLVKTECSEVIKLFIIWLMLWFWRPIIGPWGNAIQGQCISKRNLSQYKEKEKRRARNRLETYTTQQLFP